MIELGALVHTGNDLWIRSENLLIRILFYNTRTDELRLYHGTKDEAAEFPVKNPNLIYFMVTEVSYSEPLMFVDVPDHWLDG